MLMRWNLFKWWYNRIQYVGYLIHDLTSRTLGFKETVVGYSGMSQCRLTCEEFKSSIKKGGSEKEEALTHNLKTVTWQVVKTRIGRNSPNKIGSSTNSMDVARKLPYPKNLCEFAIFPQEIINEFIEFPKSPFILPYIYEYHGKKMANFILSNLCSEFPPFFPTFFLLQSSRLSALTTDPELWSKARSELLPDERFHRALGKICQAPLSRRKLRSVTNQT